MAVPKTFTESGSTASPETLAVQYATKRLRDLNTLEGRANARYMPAAEFTQLVDNLRRDGVLTSAPLIYRGEVLSGNHRVMAALKAGIEEATCIDILTELTPDRKLAIQLAHNAIAGKDDLSILADLYARLDFKNKSYSGLTDEYFGKLQELDIASLGIGGPQYEELVLTFLPEDAKEFTELVKRLTKKPRKCPTLVAHREDWDTFFETIIRVKTKLNIHNTALAVRMMASLAVERMEQVDAEPAVATSVVESEIPRGEPS